MVSTTTKFPQHEGYTAKDIFEWLESLQVNRSKEERSKLSLAVEYAMQHHTNASGGLDANSLTRNIAIADELVEMNLDVDTLCVAILHNPLSSDADLDKLDDLFGDNVCRMSKELAKVEKVMAQRRVSDHMDDEHVENMRRLLLNVADDIRVILIILAARLEFMRGLKRFPIEEQELAAKDTHALYAPLANRLGIWQIKWELEDLSLRYSQPDIYDEMVRLVGAKRSKREHFIQNVIDLINEQLEIAKIDADVYGRPKHIYSIWKKMQRKSVGFHQIFDLRAVRILVNTIPECYTALGIVHSMWPHIPGEFDDYIATPKANLYRSIHTAVIGPKDKPIEIQIRTHEMHAHNELGVAAHWRYKEQGKADPQFEKRIVMIRNWLETNDDSCFQEDSDNQVSEIDASRIYVFTPKGKVIELPKGCTPLDFAYHIHTDIGHRCRGAKVDGKIRPLTSRLKSGQLVEIITSKQPNPSRDWLNSHLGYLNTSKAKNRVRHWFKEQNYEENIQLGKQSLENELQRLNVDKPDITAQLQKFNFKTEDDLYAAIGNGDVSPIQVASAGIKKEDKLPPVRPARSSRRQETRLCVEGMDDVMTTFANCCKPVPFDPIEGFITQGKGVSVHRQGCSDLEHLKKENPDRIVKVQWLGKEIDHFYPVDVMVEAYDRKGLLRDISGIFANENVDVTQVNTQSDKQADRANMQFKIEIRDVTQLSRVLEKISQLTDVIGVRRQG